MSDEVDEALIDHLISLGRLLFKWLAKCVTGSFGAQLGKAQP